MSLLFTTLPSGEVRDATHDEEDRFMQEMGPDHPLSKLIMEQRQACEAGPVRKPSGEPNRSRNRKGTKAPAKE